MKRSVRVGGGLRPAEVAAVVPTRGDVDMRPIVEPLKVFGEVVVWDNSEDVDLGVYGRYEAINDTTRSVIVTIDDDNVATPELIDGLLAAYQPGAVVCNVPRRFRDRYHDSGLVGFGAIFDRTLPAEAFTRFDMNTPFATPVDNGKFYRTCDLIFTMLTPMIFVDLPYVELDYAHADNRMWKQPDHGDEREYVRNLCRQIRDAA